MIGSLTVSAQLARKSAGKNHRTTMQSAHSTARHAQSTNNTNAVVWSDDFSDAANWTLSSEAPTTDLWVIGTTGPSGPYLIDPIASSTAANGFALFDSDLLCSGDQVAYLTTANSIDLTGHASVRLQFSQYYRRYDDSTYVSISTDGTTWTDISVNQALNNNDFSATNSAVNPDVVTLDISALAGNQATVWVRWTFWSPASYTGGAAGTPGCGYSWQIDDASISDIPSVDAIMVSKAFNGEYSFLPILDAEAFTLQGRVINGGSAALTNVSLAFNVYDATFTNVYSDASAPVASLNGGDTTAVLTGTGSYAPVDTGLYIVEQIVSVAGDVDNANDTAYAFVYVNDSTYARDQASLDGTGYLGGFGFNANTGSLGQTYHIYQASQATSATFYLDAPTAGDDITVSLWSMSGGLPDQLLGSSAAYTLTGGEAATFVTLAFATPINVTPGDYFLAIDQIGTNNLTLGASSDIFTPGTGFFMVTGGSWTDVATVAPLSFMLQLNNPSSTLVGIQNPTLNASYSVFPNPSKGAFIINGNGTDVTVNVFNSIGKLVKTSTYGSFSNEKIDLSNEAAGTYNVQIISKEGVANKQVVISAK